MKIYFLYNAKSAAPAPVFYSKSLKGETSAMELYSAITAIVINKGEIASAIFTNIKFDKLAKCFSLVSKCHDIVKSDVKGDDYKIVKPGEAWQALEAEADASYICIESYVLMGCDN